LSPESWQQAVIICGAFAFFIYVFLSRYIKNEVAYGRYIKLASVRAREGSKTLLPEVLTEFEGI
jgi:hypothetical protein